MSEAPMEQSEGEESLIDILEMQQWLDTVKAWDQKDRSNTQRDICLHLNRLRDFLQKLLTHINNMSSTTETMKTLPLLGQFLGRICWIPHITADTTSRGLLFQCLLGMYSESPKNVVEAKANQWIRKILCQLTTDEEDTAQALMKHLGVLPTEYHLRVLRKRLVMLQENIGKSCSLTCNVNERCLCDTIRTASEACIPLVTCPEAAPLISALLLRPCSDVKAALSEDLLTAISSAYSCQHLSLEEQALVSLWYHNLSSLEEAVMSLMESVLANKKSTPHEVQQQIAKSLLPKACAQHCSIFLVVNDIFRCALKQMEENESLKFLIKTFTSCFLKELSLQQEQQKCVSLKAFFLQSPQCMLQPLLTQPSDMLEDAWGDHLNWLSASLRRLTEEEEDADGSNRGLPLVFEAWFLLVCCAHWVDVALHLLVTSADRDCDVLLWLLTFYYHPTNRGHHRDQLLSRTREVWDGMSCLFSAAGCPPVDGLQILASLLSPQPQQPSLAPLLILKLLVSFAVFSQLPLSGSSQVLHTVVEQAGLTDEAACVLSSLELRLTRGGGCSSGQTNTALHRIKALHQALTQHTST